MKRKLFTLAALAIAILSTAAWDSYLASYVNTTKIGTFFTTSAAFDSSTEGMIGGETRIYKDSTDTLLVGDVVYLSRANTVHKTTTLASYNAIVGVVVGGSNTHMQGANSTANLGDTACFAHGRVLVLKRGRFFVKVDSAGVAPGLALIPSTSLAGAAKARTTAIDTFFRVYAMTLDTAIAGSAVMVDIAVKR